MCEWSLLWVDCCSPQWSLLQALGCCSRVKATTPMLNRHWSSLHLLQKGEKPDRTVLCTELLSGRLWLQRNPVQKHTHTPLLLCFARCWDSCRVRPFSSWIKTAATCWVGVWGGRNVCGRVNNVNFAGEEGRFQLSPPSPISVWRSTLEFVSW